VSAMEPTYHLEGIVKSKEEMEDFEGPLNLILTLLSKNKIEIRDLQISVILEQYLDYLAKMEELDLEIASEFVQMASHLLFIKTKTLLSGEEEVSELEILMSSLEQLRARDLYGAVRAVVPELSRASEQGILLFSSPGETLPKYGEYTYQHEPVELLQAFKNLFSKGNGAAEEELQQNSLIPKRIVYNVRDKSRQILQELQGGKPVSLAWLYGLCGSRSELVATFVSILELCATGSIWIQKTPEEELTVVFRGGEIEQILNEILPLSE
jgi:segregation and condensation protein A